MEVFMANILTYVRTLFNWLFVTSTGENSQPEL